MEDLWHDACRHEVVGPDAAVDEFAGDVEVRGFVEDFGAQGDHAPSEAGEVLDLRVEGDAYARYDLDAARKQNIVVADCHWAKEDVAFYGYQCGLIQSLVLEF